MPLADIDWEYILSPPAWLEARTIRKVELGHAGLVPFPCARMAVSLLFNIINQPQGLTPMVLKKCEVSKENIFCGYLLNSY